MELACPVRFGREQLVAWERGRISERLHAMAPGRRANHYIVIIRAIAMVYVFEIVEAC
jgi:hypothetical protein